MRMVFASDLHGRSDPYENLLALCHRQGADCLLLGGDLLPTRIGGVAKLLTGSADFDAGLQAQIRFIDDILAPRLSAFLTANPRTRVYYIPGNHDWVPAMEHLAREVPAAENIHGRCLRYRGLHFCGYGCVTDSSFWVKDYVRRDLPQDGPIPSRFACISTPQGIRPSLNGSYISRFPSMAEELARLPVATPARTVCVFHSPPYASGLDTLHNGKPIGSHAVRTFIETRQPLITLHGHIHEAPYMSGIYQAHIGRSLAVNPGQGREGLHAVTIDVDRSRIFLSHTLFDKAPPGRGDLLERLTLKVKSILMRTVLHP